jgi:hypothetical protein
MISLDPKKRIVPFNEKVQLKKCKQIHRQAIKKGGNKLPDG